jgi:hypothetical protein
MATASVTHERQHTMAILGGAVMFSVVMSVVAESVGVTEDAGDKLPIDGLDLLARAEFERVGRDSVGIAQPPLGLLVDERERVRVEDGPFRARSAKPMRDVLGGVAGRCLA